MLGANRRILRNLSSLGAVALLGTAMCFGAWTSSALAASDQKDTVAVVAVKTPVSLKDDRSAIEDEIARGLASAGWSVLDLAETTRRINGRQDLADCSAEACLMEITRLTKALYVLRGTITSSHKKYSIELKVFDAAGGSEIADETVECLASNPGCPPVAKNAYTGARFVGRKALQTVRARARDRDTAATAPATPTPPISAPEAPPAVEVKVPPPPPPITVQHPSRPVPPPRSNPWVNLRTAGWAAVAAGGVLVLGGGYYWLGDGDEVDCHIAMTGRTRCHRAIDDRSRMYALGGAGLAVAALGVSLLVFGNPESTSAVVLSPEGVGFWGRF